MRKRMMTLSRVRVFSDLANAGLDVVWADMAAAGEIRQLRSPGCVVDGG